MDGADALAPGAGSLQVSYVSYMGKKPLWSGEVASQGASAVGGEPGWDSNSHVLPADAPLAHALQDAVTLIPTPRRPAAFAKVSNSWDATFGVNGAMMRSVKRSSEHADELERQQRSSFYLDNPLDTSTTGRVPSAGRVQVPSSQFALAELNPTAGVGKGPVPKLFPDWHSGAARTVGGNNANHYKSLGAVREPGVLSSRPVASGAHLRPPLGPPRLGALPNERPKTFRPMLEPESADQDHVPTFLLKHLGPMSSPRHPHLTTSFDSALEPEPDTADEGHLRFKALAPLPVQVDAPPHRTRGRESTSGRVGSKRTVLYSNSKGSTQKQRRSTTFTTTFRSKPIVKPNHVATSLPSLKHNSHAPALNRSPLHSGSITAGPFKENVHAEESADTAALWKDPNPVIAQPTTRHEERQEDPPPPHVASIAPLPRPKPLKRAASARLSDVALPRGVDSAVPDLEPSSGTHMDPDRNTNGASTSSKAVENPRRAQSHRALPSNKMIPSPKLASASSPQIVVNNMANNGWSAVKQNPAQAASVSLRIIASPDLPTNVQTVVPDVVMMTNLPTSRVPQPLTARERRWSSRIEVEPFPSGVSVRKLRAELAAELDSFSSHLV